MQVYGSRLGLKRIERLPNDLNNVLNVCITIGGQMIVKVNGINVMMCDQEDQKQSKPIY